MNVAQQQHPSPGQLLDFAHGRLHEPEFAEIEEHLSACDACCEWISRQPDSALLTLAREVATVSLRAGATQKSPAVGEIPAALVNHPRYRVMEQIGIGGMGSVYKAEHRLMQRTVALKIVHPWLLSNAHTVERFKREVRVAAKLAHPNVVVSYDADEAESLHFLVMEYVEGETLSEKIAREGPATIEQACDWISQAALGLQHAHERGMAHRDIKPHNLMVTPEGQIRILDFGLSRLVTEQVGQLSETLAGQSPTSHTHADTILGTPDYIAPEQIASSRGADIRADIYSLGCTLYFLLAGRPPFVGGSVVATLHAHEKTPFPSLDQARSDAPPKLVEILRRMTAKLPADRYATPGEVAQDLALLSTDAAKLGPGAGLDSVPPLPLAARSAVVQSATVAMKSRWVRTASSRFALPGIGAACGALLLYGLATSGYLSPTAANERPTAILVMLPSQGLWFPDYRELVEAAEGTNAQLTFASIANKPSEVLSASEPGIAVPDVKLGPSLTADEFEAVIFIGYETMEFSPGGAGGADTKRLLNEFQMQKKVVASLCAGQRVLAQQGALRGKKVAPCPSVKPDEITYEGGTRTDRSVEVDGLVVTASDAKDSPEFLRAILKLRQP